MVMDSAMRTFGLGRTSAALWGLTLAGTFLVAAGCDEGPGMLADVGSGADAGSEFAFIGAAGDQGTGGMGVGGTGAAAGGGGSGSMGAADGSADSPDGGMLPAADAPEHLPSCIDDPAQVAILGDSYVDWVTHTFLSDFATESGKQWTSYAVGGNSMATGGAFGTIPDQYELAVASHPDLKLVIMDGGGNDILVPDTVMFPEAGQCTHTPDAPMIADCQAVVTAALDKAEALMLESADAGVRDIIYFFYPHIPGGGLISGPHPNEILDHALPKARAICESAYEKTEGRMKCHFVDMVPEFEGKQGLFADVWSEAGDGVHPNAMGSKVMAKAVWRTMVEQCVGQPSSAGCCLKE